MKRWIAIALAVGMTAAFAQAEENDDDTQMPMRGMYMQNMGMQGGNMPMQRRNMRDGYDCPYHGMGMMDGMGYGMGPGMMGGMGYGMGPGMMGGMGMMGYGMGMMGDPETQKAMQESMMEFQKQMMKQRLEFQQKMRKQMMSQPRVIVNMLNMLLENPDALEKTLDANPDLKAKLKKAL